MYYGHTMRRRNMHLAEQQIERLEALAEKTGLSVAELIRRAIDRYLKAEEDEQNATTTAARI